MPDVIIIGLGPAGASAAIYLCRANRRALLVGKDFGALQKAEKIENYFGLEEPISGEALAHRGLEQARSLGAEILFSEALDLSWEPEGFRLLTGEGEASAPCVILATGASRRTLPIPGLAALEGHGVSYCAVCDAFFYRGRSVGVLSAGDYALHEAAHLLPVAGGVTLFTNGAPVPEGMDPRLSAVTDPLAALVGDEQLSAVRLAGGREVPVEGLFVALGSASAGDFARKLGAEVKNGSIVVDDSMQTAVPGLFAAGDCTGGLLQVSTAVGDGARAAMGVLRYLRESGK